MKYRHFYDFVKSFDQFSTNRATTIKPFIKTHYQTYGQLQKRIYKTANYLTAKGIKKSDRIMLIAPNSPQWIELFLACQIVGATLVPVDTRNSLDTTLSFTKQTKPKLIIKSKVLLPKLDNQKHIIMLEDLDLLIEVMPATVTKTKLTGKETALIVFTSGTTAEPKGVMLTQKNILTNVDGVNKAIRIEPSWRFLSVLPLSHMYELTGTCCIMSVGASIYYLPRILPLAIAKALNDYKITTLLAVPQLLILFRQRILQTAEAEGQAKKLNKALKIAKFLPFRTRRIVLNKVHKKLGGCLQLVITGGAPIPPEVADFWENLGVKAIQGYGLTETAPILTANRLDKRRSDSQGIKLHNVELKISDQGEILAKGDNVFSGYWQNPQQTKAVFTKDGWFKTGDIGKFEGEWLKIQGRAKFAIILPSGLNVYPEDIEAKVENHPEFKEICVVGVAKDNSEEVQAVVISDHNDFKIQQAINDINAELESHQYISSWVRWPDQAFPRTLLLKIDRKNIQLWANQHLHGQTELKPQISTQDDPIINIIRLVTDNSHLSIKDADRIGDLGLDSLRRLVVVSLVEEQLGISLSETLVTSATTVKQLRTMIKSGNHSSNQSEAKRPSWQYSKLARFIGNGLRESLVRGFLRIWVKTKVEGTENIKNLRTPAIFIFNHVDNLDAGVIYQSLPSKIRNHLAAAIADDVWKNRNLLRPFVRLCFAGFNFKREGAIIPSLEYTSNLIDQGWNIAIAPEGSIELTDKLREFKSGVGLLAVETGVPIVPIKTIGLYGTFPLGHKRPTKMSQVVVKIGTPVTFSNKVHYEQATRELHKIMKNL